MEGLALAFAAGLVTLLNPCVLPLLPVVVGSALQAGRLGPVALGLGLALSFAVFGTAATTFGFAIGLDQAILRQAGARLLVGFLILSGLDKRIEAMLVGVMPGRLAAFTTRW